MFRSVVPKYDESKVSKEDIEATIEKAGYVVKK